MRPCAAAQRRQDYVIEEGFCLRQVADTWVVLPLAEQTVNFTGMITLNESGAMLWQQLEQGKDREGLIAALTAEYDVSEEVASADVDAFLNKLNSVGCFE